VVVLMTTIATFKVFAQVFVTDQGADRTATYVPSYYTYLNFFQEGTWSDWGPQWPRS